MYINMLIQVLLQVIYIYIHDYFENIYIHTHMIICFQSLDSKMVIF